MKRLATAAIALALLGCATNPGVTRLSGDTYILSRVDRGGIFGNEAALLADVLREANEFAESKNMAALPVSLQQRPMQIGAFASVQYQFQLVEKNDPRLRAGAMDFRPQQVIESRQR